MADPLHTHFEDIEVGQVLQLGACAVDEAAIELFVAHFAPGWDPAYGAPDALVYALWSRLASDKSAGGRMTVMGKDPVGDEKGIVIAQHDLLDEGGRLVFSCLTRGVFVRR